MQTKQYQRLTGGQGRGVHNKKTWAQNRPLFTDGWAQSVFRTCKNSGSGSSSNSRRKNDTRNVNDKHQKRMTQEKKV